MFRSAIAILIMLPTLSAKTQQFTISKLSLTDTTQNIFYIGVDNLIKISGKQYDPTKQHIVIMGGGGTLHKKETGVYIVRVQEETDNCHIWITENKKPVFKQNYRCRKIEGDPIARLTGVKDSFATIEQIVTSPTVVVEIPGTFYKHQCKVISFALSMDCQIFEDMWHEEITGHIIPEGAISRIKKVRKDSGIFFDNIYAVSADGRRRKLKPFRITIK